MKKLKRSMYFLSALFLLVPFVLLTDIFPFLRFAMFAEPLRYAPQTEVFYVSFKNRQGQWEKFDPEKFELQEEIFQYLSRNYYYRGQGYVLLEKLRNSRVDTTITAWRFEKVSFSADSPEKKDTTVITTLE